MARKICFFQIYRDYYHLIKSSKLLWLPLIPKRNLYFCAPAYLVLLLAAQLCRAAGDRLTFTDDSLGLLPRFRVSFTVIPRLRRVSVQAGCPYFSLLRWKDLVRAVNCTFSAISAIRSGAFANSMYRAIALVKLFVSRPRKFPGYPWRSDIRRPSFHRDIFHGEIYRLMKREIRCRAIAIRICI